LFVKFLRSVVASNAVVSDRAGFVTLEKAFIVQVPTAAAFPRQLATTHIHLAVRS